MISAYIAILKLKPRPTNIGIQKIDGPIQETYDIALASFLL